MQLQRHRRRALPSSRLAWLCLLAALAGSTDANNVPVLLVSTTSGGKGGAAAYTTTTTTTGSSLGVSQQYRWPRRAGPALYSSGTAMATPSWRGLPSGASLITGSSSDSGSKPTMLAGAGVTMMVEEAGPAPPKGGAAAALTASSSTGTSGTKPTAFAGVPMMVEAGPAPPRRGAAAALMAGSSSGSGTESTASAGLPMMVEAGPAPPRGAAAAAAGSAGSGAQMPLPANPTPVFIPGQGWATLIWAPGSGPTGALADGPGARPPSQWSGPQGQPGAVAPPSALGAGWGSTAGAGAAGSGGSWGSGTAPTAGAGLSGSQPGMPRPASPPMPAPAKPWWATPSAPPTPTAAGKPGSSPPPTRRSQDDDDWDEGSGVDAADLAAAPKPPTWPWNKSPAPAPAAAAGPPGRVASPSPSPAPATAGSSSGGRASEADDQEGVMAPGQKQPPAKPSPSPQPAPASSKVVRVTPVRTPPAAAAVDALANATTAVGALANVTAGRPAAAASAAAAAGPGAAVKASPAPAGATAAAATPPVADDSEDDTSDEDVSEDADSGAAGAATPAPAAAQAGAGTASKPAGNAPTTAAAGASKPAANATATAAAGGLPRTVPVLPIVGVKAGGNASSTTAAQAAGTAAGPGNSTAAPPKAAAAGEEGEDTEPSEDVDAAAAATTAPPERPPMAVSVPAGGAAGGVPPSKPASAGSPEAGSRAAGNASALSMAGTGTGSNKTAMPAAAAGSAAATTTAAAAGSFTLPSVLAPKAAGAGSALQSSDVNSTSLRGPEPVIFNSPGATKTVLIGCALPLEGTDHDVGGRAVLQGVKMALTDLLPELKLGVNVNLTCLNSKCLDIPAFMATKQLAKDGAIAVIGEICSAASVAAGGVANEFKIPLISPSSSSPQLTGMDYFYRTVPSDRYQGAAAAEFARAQGYRNVGVVYEDVSYGFGLSFNFIASFTRDGGSVPVVHAFKKFQGVPAEAVAKLLAGKEAKDNKLDAVFLSTNNLTFAADFLRAAADANLGLPVLAGDAMASPAMADLLKGNTSVLGQLTATSWGMGTPAFIKRFKAAAPAVEYDSRGANGYDAMAALLRAYAATPAPREPAAVAENIVKQAFAGVSGPIAFDKYGDLVPNNNTYITVTWDGSTGNMQPGKPLPLP